MDTLRSERAATNEGAPSARTSRLLSSEITLVLRASRIGLDSAHDDASSIYARVAPSATQHLARKRGTGTKEALRTSGNPAQALLKDALRDINKCIRTAVDKVDQSRSLVQQDLNDRAAFMQQQEAAKEMFSNASHVSESDPQKRVYSLNMIKNVLLRNTSMQERSRAAWYLQDGKNGRFLDAAVHFFLAYLRFLRAHARILVCESPHNYKRFDSILYICPGMWCHLLCSLRLIGTSDIPDLDFSESSPAARSIQAETDRKFQDLTLRYTEMVLNLRCNPFADMDTSFEEMYSWTRELLLAIFPKYLTNIESHLRQMFTISEQSLAAESQSTYSLTGVNSENKNANLDAASKKKHVPRLSGAQRAHRLEKRSVLLTARIPTTVDHVLACKDRDTGMDKQYYSFFPHAFRALHMTVVNGMLARDPSENEISQDLGILIQCDQEWKELSNMELC